MNLNKNRLEQPGETSALVDRLDQALVEWAALYGGVWSGTAGELAVAVKAAADVADDIWPSSASALLAHIESRQQVLRSMGTEFSLTSTYPRMISVRPGQDERPGHEPPAGFEIKAATGEEPHAISSNPDESVFDSTAETLIAMLRTSTPPEPGTPTTISKLAAAPAHLRSAFKKAWMRRPRAM